MVGEELGVTLLSHSIKTSNLLIIMYLRVYKHFRAHTNSVRGPR